MLQVWARTFIEALALVALILVSLFKGNPATRNRLQVFSRWFQPSQRHPAIAFLLVGLLAFTANALATGLIGIPQPRVHDEFSYLLAADTFAHGRLTNPPHPMWKHFESFHIIQQPTYASKYPPAQGLMLAFGRVIFGHPIVGVWLSTALACAAISWMLAGWCSLRWAWIGGLVAVLRLVFSGPISLRILESAAYWSQSYWGGSVAALGGALVFGALPRIMKRQRLRDALWLALGLAILANSRPFEGLVASLPVAVTLGIWMVRTKGIFFRGRLYRFALPLVLVLLVTASWMGFYNFRVTGDPFRMPFQVHEATYRVVPLFLWQPLMEEPRYNHQTLSDLHVGWSYDSYQKQQSFLGWGQIKIRTIASLWLFYIGILFTPFMAALPWMWRRWNVKFALTVWTLMLSALLTETWVFPHYAAPVTCLAFLLIVESLRQARLIKWRGRRVGRTLVGAVLPVLLLSSIASFALEQHLKGETWHLERARILQGLERGRERNLVFVRYDPDHRPHDQWVYNRADIDAAKVVWAWEMGPQADKELLDYFKDRRVWLLQADKLPRHLEPYPGTPFKETAGSPSSFLRLGGGGNTR